jgi:hypothetical protein
MSDKLEYLQVVISFVDDDYSGQVHWPKSNENLSEFISQEWYVNSILCLNHFGSRGWEYVETKEETHCISLLFIKKNF